MNESDSSVAPPPRPPTSSGASSPRVVLIGPPGSGKTTVGRLLANRWGIDLLDTDQEIERATGRSVSDLFVEEGEPHFRELERAAVAAALSTCAGVVALGAGAVLSDQTRDLLRSARVVHLEVGLAAAMRRLEMNRSRPLLIGNVRGRWQQLADERRPLYTEVAAVTVTTDDRTAQQVSDAIVSALGELAPAEEAQP